MTDNFCGFKTAYLLDDSFDNLVEAITEDIIFELMEEEKLPQGWTFRGTDISGAAGFVLLFDIDGIPTEPQLKAVEKSLQQLEERLC